MRQFDYDGSGKRDIECTAYTAFLYEVEFGKNIASDVFGRVEDSASKFSFEEDAEGKVRITAIDYTVDSYDAYLRALWAMLRTASDIEYEAGDLAPNARVPAFAEWVRGVGAVNLDDIGRTVQDEILKGLFRPAASASGTTGDEG